MSISLSFKIRRVSWVLYSVRIRQAARRVFDLTHIGNGPIERLASAIILGAVFFFGAFLIAHFARLQPGYVITIAIVALVSVMMTSGMLVLWDSDRGLEREALDLTKQLLILQEEAAEARVAAAEARAEREAEEAQWAAEREFEDAERMEEEAARPRPTTKRCPYCREQILIRALICKHCGEILDEQLREERRPRRPQHWNPGVAAVLSFFYPGLGQMYKGQVLSGLVWMFLVPLGYTCCLIPGFFLHVICIFGAASGSE